MNKEIKHALEVCKRVMQHACEVGDSDWSVYSGFREARQAIEAAEQKRAADSANVCPECGEPFDFCAMGHYDVAKARRG